MYIIIKHYILFIVVFQSEASFRCMCFLLMSLNAPRKQQLYFGDWLEESVPAERHVMADPELLLDSSIRMWVVLPIVFITFFVGIIRHYVTQLLHSDKKVDLEQVSDR